MVIKEGVGIMATGEKTDNGLSVTAYIWTDGTYGATPEVYGLVCETAAEKEGEGKPVSSPTATSTALHPSL